MTEEYVTTSSIISAYTWPNQVYPCERSIEQTHDNGISIFPNPTIEKIKIDFSQFLGKNEFLYSMEILDNQGKVLKEITGNTLNNGFVLVDFEGFPPGLYFLRVNGSSTSSIQKFIKI